MSRKNRKRNRTTPQIAAAPVISSSSIVGAKSTALTAGGSATLLKAKLDSLKGSTVYKDDSGKWRLAETWVVTEMEVKRVQPRRDEV